MIKKALKFYGSIDAVVNNAATKTSNLKNFFKKFEDQVRNPETQPRNDNVIQEEEPQMEGEQPRGLMARGGM